jgi:hypothetical protein
LENYYDFNSMGVKPDTKKAKQKSLVYQGFNYEWCRGGDLNPHALASGRF